MLVINYMADRALRGYSSEVVRELNRCLPKAWRYIDFIFSTACDNHDHKKDAAFFLLGKALPNMSLNHNLNEGTLELSAESKAAILTQLGITQTCLPINTTTPS